MYARVESHSTPYIKLEMNEFTILFRQIHFCDEFAKISLYMVLAR